jgi:hypothetical protein
MAWLVRTTRIIAGVWTGGPDKPGYDDGKKRQPAEQNPVPQMCGSGRVLGRLSISLSPDLCLRTRPGHSIRVAAQIGRYQALPFRAFNRPIACPTIRVGSSDW